MKVALFRPP